jgi:type I restriction enzyme S subunit
MNAERLLEVYEQISEAPDAIARLRRFVLDLAVRGKLVEQDAEDEPAAELLKQIAIEKEAANVSGRKRSRKTASGTNKSEGSAFRLPASWQWTTLAEVSHQIHYGYTASAAPHEKEHRLLRITDIQNDRVDWDSVPGCIIDKETFAKYALQTNDLLIARTGGTIGKTFLVDTAPVKSVFASYLIRVQPTSALSAHYIKLFCGSDTYWDQLREGSRGGGQPNVNGQTLGGLKVPLPPLAEQHRIVAKVDELMALCDRLEEARKTREEVRAKLTAASLARLTAPDASAEDFPTHAAFALEALPALTTRPDQIKTLRQTILNLAVRGKLVEQDPADEPAAALLKKAKALKSKAGIKEKADPADNNDIPFTAPLGWSWTRVGTIALQTGSGSTPRGGKSAYADEGTPFLRSQNIYDDGLRLDDVVFINHETNKKMKRTQVKAKDLLLNITGGSIGRCARIPDEFAGANVSQHVAIIRTAASGTEDYLHLLVRSPFFQEYVVGEQTGAGRGGLPKNRMDRIPVPLPPLAEQRRILAKVDALMTFCDLLEAALTTADTTRTRLLEALLHEALEPAADQAASAA